MTDPLIDELIQATGDYMCHAAELLANIEPLDRVQVEVELAATVLHFAQRMAAPASAPDEIAHRVFRVAEQMRQLHTERTANVVDINGKR